VDRWYTEIARRSSYQESNDTPLSNITPRYKMDFCLNTTTSDWYISHGKTDSDWQQIT